MKKGNASLEINMVLNAIKSIMRIIFPLITFPYASKVLGAENLGKYNFASTFVGYFVLLSALGISTYAIREGTKLRNNKELLERFAAEIYTINVVSTVISYVVLFLFCVFYRELYDYNILIALLSLQIVFNTIGVEWIYSIYEDYAYITTRSIIFQFFSLIMLFVMVHDENDLIPYVLITVFSSVGSNVLNYFHAKKYCRIKITKHINYKVHLLPIIVLFATTVTVRIYSSSDITILGLICGDYVVGIYSVSTKVYELVKTLLSSVIIVSIPRLSSLIGKSKEMFDKTADEVYRILIVLVFPVLLGIFLLRKEIILLIADETYLGASMSLAILSGALAFSLLGWFWGQCILVPYNREKEVLKASAVSAIVNIGLNLILIPKWQQNAAAFTTLIAEVVQYLWCKQIGKQYVRLSKSWNCFVKTLVGCIPICGIDYILRQVQLNYIVRTVLIVALSAIFYVVIEIILRNDIVIDLFNMVKNKIQKATGRC